MKILPHSYIPCNTLLPFSTRKVHIENWLEDAKNRNDNLEDFLVRIDTFRQEVKEIKDLSDTRIMVVLKKKKILEEEELKAAEAAGSQQAPPTPVQIVPESQFVQAVESLKAIADAMGNSTITCHLEAVAGLIRGMAAPATPVADVPMQAAPSPVEVPVVTCTSGPEGPPGEPPRESEHHEDAPKSKKLRRKTGPEEAAHAGPSLPASPRDIPISGESSDLDSRSTGSSPLNKAAKWKQQKQKEKERKAQERAEIKKRQQDTRLAKAKLK